MCVRFDRSHSFPPKLMVLTHLCSAFDSHSAVMHSQRSCSCFLNRVFSAAAYLSHLDWHLTIELDFSPIEESFMSFNFKCLDHSLMLAL